MTTYAAVAQAGSNNVADLTDTFGDLDAFKDTGGKMVTVVGTNDALIMKAYYCDGGSAALDHYSERALARVWKAERFSIWMTSMLHRYPGSDRFQYRAQIAELDYLTSSVAATTALAENYVGLPM